MSDAQIFCTLAATSDAPAIASVRNAAAQQLTEAFGVGHWSANCTEAGVLWGMGQGNVLVARNGRRIIGTVTFGTRKPWAIDPAYFAKSRKPFYITNMAVLPEEQGAGIGRKLVEAAKSVALDQGGDALRLDAWDAEAGAGAFYAKCGFKEVGRAVYRKARLIYFELKTDSSASSELIVPGVASSASRSNKRAR